MVFTNATPTGAIRGAGRPNAAFALERLVDSIARELGIDRAEVRRRNFVPASDLPYEVDIAASDGRKVTYDSGDYQAAMETALSAADINGFERRKTQSARTGSSVAMAWPLTSRTPVSGLMRAPGWKS